MSETVIIAGIFLLLIIAVIAAVFGMIWLAPSLRVMNRKFNIESDYHVHSADFSGGGSTGQTTVWRTPKKSKPDSRTLPPAHRKDSNI